MPRLAQPMKLPVRSCDRFRDQRGGGKMTQAAVLPGGRAESYEVIGRGRPALMLAGGPGFTASYLNGDAELLSDVLAGAGMGPG